MLTYTVLLLLFFTTKVLRIREKAMNYVRDQLDLSLSTVVVYLLSQWLSWAACLPA